MQVKGYHWLPIYDRPIIGFDFDQTISVNGHSIIKPALDLFDHLENRLGYLPVIISGRSPDDYPITTYKHVITIHNNPNMDYFRKTFNSIRFKFWVLNFYYANGKGDLLFYVDGDQKVIDALYGMNIPAVSLKTKPPAEWSETINFWIRFFIDRK